VARVTVEDCIDKVPNRFDLVLIASQRTRQLAAGATKTVEAENDRPPVLALREIAAGTVDPQKLTEGLMIMYRRDIQREVSPDIAEHLEEETKPLQDFSPELSLTGEIDEVEAELEAEFSQIEKGLE
jgi:DNA-directed RNA polymerase subunit omega